MIAATIMISTSVKPACFAENGWRTMAVLALYPDVICQATNKANRLVSPLIPCHSPPLGGNDR
jgi:hypothetical protein